MFSTRSPAKATIRAGSAVVCAIRSLCMCVCVCVSQFSLPGEETLSFSCIMGDAASVTVCLFLNVVCVNNLCVYACLCACDILFVCVVHILCGSGGYNGSAWARKKRESDGQQTSSVSVCERLQRARIYAVLITSLQSGTAYILQKKKKNPERHTHTNKHTHRYTHKLFPQIKKS